MPERFDATFIFLTETNPRRRLAKVATQWIAGGGLAVAAIGFNKS
jgi:hypothetical protein